MEAKVLMILMVVIRIIKPTKHIIFAESVLEGILIKLIFTAKIENFYLTCKFRNALN